MEGGVRRILRTGGRSRLALLIGSVATTFVVMAIAAGSALAASAIDYQLTSDRVVAGDDVVVEGAIEPAAAGVEVVVALDGADVATVVTATDGSFVATFAATVSGLVTARIPAQSVVGPELALTVDETSGQASEEEPSVRAEPSTIVYAVDPLEAWFDRELTVIGSIDPPAAGVEIAIAYDGADVATVTTDAAGAFSATIVPDAAGTLTARIVAEDVTGPAIPVAWATSSIDYSLQRSSVAYGNDVVVEGAVEPAVEGTEVAVACNGADVATATTDAAGAFTATFVAGAGGSVRQVPEVEPGDFYTRATRNFRIRRCGSALFRYQVVYGPPEGETDEGVTCRTVLKIRDANDRSRGTTIFEDVPVNTTQTYRTTCCLRPGYYTYYFLAQLPDGTRQQRAERGRFVVRYRNGRMPQGSFASSSAAPTSVVTARIVADGTEGPEVPLTIRPKASIRYRGGYPFLWAKLTITPTPSSYRGTAVVKLVRRGRVVGTKTVRMRGTTTVRVPVKAMGTCRAYVTLKSWKNIAERQFSKAFTLRIRKLRTGSRGGHVRGVVNQLRRLGFFTPRSTSRFDGRVADAVLAFQKTYGLRRDRVFNSADWRKLDRARKPRVRYRSPRLHIEISKRKQTLTVVKNGRPYRIIHVSTGATGNTPVGRHYIRWKAYSAPTPYGGLLYWDMEFYPRYAIHAYPFVPPWPASHGCVRVPRWIAPSLYRMSHVGETVYVYW